MKILIVGAGVIGSVYGAQLAAGGHAVSVLRHGARTDEVARAGLIAREVGDERSVATAVRVASDPNEDAYDLVLVAVRLDQLAAATAELATLRGRPALVFFGNNPAGRAAVAGRAPGDVFLGFPGIGGVLVDGTAEYVRIPQQPAALESAPDPRLNELAATLEHRGFAVQRVDDMDGWLAYHAVFIACVAAALERCGTDAERLSRDRQTLRLMCLAVTEGFAVLRGRGVPGLPRNLGVLHRRLLVPFAVRYWARAMRSPMGELCFAAHVRHTPAETAALRNDVLASLSAAKGIPALHQLLGAA